MQVVRERRRDGMGETHRDTTRWREALEAEPRLRPLRDQEVDHEHRTNRDRMVAMIASFSAIGSLPEDRRAAALDAVRDVLERHDVDETTLRFRTLMTTAERVDA
jgi:hypothetical protein